MNTLISTSHRGLTALGVMLLVTAGGWSGASFAKVTDLSTTPPNLTTTVAPNVAVTFDDSGSMASNYMGDTRPFDNNGWSTGSPWFCAGVIDPRATDTTSMRMQTMNGVYYNPNISYTPPNYADGTSFPNADATLSSVPVDGISVYRPTTANQTAQGTPAYRSNTVGSSDDVDGRMAILNGTKGTKTDTRYSCSGSLTSPFDGNFVDADGNKPNGGPYYYRLKAGVTIATSGVINTGTLYNASNWEPVAVPASQYQNFANWYAYYRVRHLMARTSVSQAFSKIGNTIQIAWQNLASTGSPAVQFATSGKSQTYFQQIGGVTDPVREAFYDWLFQVVGGNSTPARAATIRAGELFRTALTQNKYDPYWNGVGGNQSKDLICRKNFHMLITDGYWNEGDPALPTGMSSSTDVQKTGKTLPDGTVYTPQTTVTKIFSNVVGNYPSSMANIAWFYWSTDLQTGLTNGVKPYWADLTAPTTVDPSNPGATPTVYWNPVNDPATWQHVSQFFVTLGVAGTLRFPDDYAGLLAGTKQWPTPSNNSGPAVDDTWHAGLNSRGGFFNAANPQNLVTSLISIINSVISASSAAVSATLNSGVLSDNSVTYIPNFKSSDWSGSLIAKAVSSTGAIGVTLWTAEDLLNKRAPATSGGTPRMIMTNGAQTQGGAYEFTYANLTTAQKNLMNSNDGSGSTVAAKVDGLGTNRVDWIRGARTDEGTLLRTRSTVLGAIINAQPVYVSYPSSGYRDYFPPSGTATVSPEDASASKSYSSFVAANINRDPALYVAANDGMLHVFDARLASVTGASPGAERWAYIPSTVYPNLWNLSKKDNFLFKPTVDATPIYRDVFFSGGDSSTQAWHTILVGGLRLGGRGIYALDITTPAAAAQSDVNAKFMWEFGSDSMSGATATGANLGYTFGQPNIGRLSNGKWVVVVPASYFPDPSSAAAASNTYSSLFILDAQTGAVLKEFKTPTTYNGVTINSYGLGTPVLGDYNNDQIDDVAFAGDLVGNVWRFNLTDLTSTPTLLYKPTTDEAQPITTMPRLFPDPTSQYFMVVFGTGKYLAASDNNLTGAVVQSVYGIRDTGPGASTPAAAKRSDLLMQTLAGNATTGALALTTNAITATQKGWYFDLALSVGERVVVTPAALFNTNRVVITTLLPTTTDPCDPGTSGSVLVVDSSSGAAGGGVSIPGATFGAGYAVAGVSVRNPPTSGSLPAATVIGGGQVIIPGITNASTGATFTVGAPIWRRRSWRNLNDQ